VSGDEFEVRATCVVNATGPYTDFMRRLDSPHCRKICQPSSGIHVVLPKYYRSPHLSTRSKTIYLQEIVTSRRKALTFEIQARSLQPSDNRGSFSSDLDLFRV